MTSGISPNTPPIQDISPTVEAQAERSDKSSLYKKAIAIAYSIFALSALATTGAALKWRITSPSSPTPTPANTSMPMSTLNPTLIQLSANCETGYQLPPLINMPECVDIPNPCFGEQGDMALVIGEAQKMSEDDKARVMGNIRTFGEIVTDLNTFANTHRCEEIKAKEAALMHLRNQIQRSQDTCWKLSRLRLGIQKQIIGMGIIGKAQDGRMLMLASPSNQNELDAFVNKIEEAGFQQDCKANTADCVGILPSYTPIKSITLSETPSLPLLAPYQGPKDLRFFATLNVEDLRQAAAQSREQIKKIYSDLLDETQSKVNSTTTAATKSIDSVSMRLSRAIINLFNSAKK